MPCPSSFTLGKRHSTHRVGQWVGPRASLDECRKSRPHQDSIPRLSSPRQVAIPTMLQAFVACSRVNFTTDAQHSDTRRTKYK